MMEKDVLGRLYVPFGEGIAVSGLSVKWPEPVIKLMTGDVGRVDTVLNCAVLRVLNGAVLHIPVLLSPHVRRPTQ